VFQRIQIGLASVGRAHLIEGSAHPFKPRNFWEPGSSDAFLGIAGHLQDFGLSFKPPAPLGDETLLEGRDLWRVPDEVERLYLPMPVPQLWMLNAMKKYKATARG
jgi:hypothetical protein